VIALLGNRLRLAFTETVQGRWAETSFKRVCATTPLLLANIV